MGPVPPAEPTPDGLLWEAVAQPPGLARVSDQPGLRPLGRVLYLWLSSYRLCARETTGYFVWWVSENRIN